MSDIDYASRVQRGIALLDQKWPAWATEINLDTLDIASGATCMTAQYAASQGESGWEDGMEMLSLDESSYDEHGFRTDDHHADTDYPALNGLWKAAILERRSQVQDAPAEPEATA